MKAAYYARFGGPELLNLGDLPVPEPGPDELLIRVRAAGVNPADWKLRAGRFKSAMPYAFPIIPGWDAAGEVVDFGEQVTGFHRGARVHAYVVKPVVQWGTCAEYVTVPARDVAFTPVALDDVQAAAIPLAGLTAWQALVGFAGVEAGQTVLIHAASGGVGSFAVGIAKQRGATVIGTAGLANADYVRSLGADSVVDHNAPDMAAGIRAAAPEGVDVVLDAVGGEALRMSYELLNPGGAIVSLVERPDHDQCAHRDLACTQHSSRPDGRQLAELSQLIADGTIPLPEIRTMPLERIAEAHRLSEAGHVRGKIVLTIS